MGHAMEKERGAYLWALDALDNCGKPWNCGPASADEMRIATVRHRHPYDAIINSFKRKSDYRSALTRYRRDGISAMADR
jgi:hypothetical protein